VKYVQLVMMFGAGWRSGKLLLWTYRSICFGSWPYYRHF